MRQIIDFRNISDTGEIDAAAIVPYNDGEAATQAVFRRPVENSRTRTETLRKLLRQHILLRDNDRAGFSLWDGGTITFNGAYSTYTGIFTITSSLFIAPVLSPGDGVGSAAPYIASTKAQLTIGTFGNNQAIITSVKKQFEGTDQAKGDINRLSVEILNDTAESIVLEGASGDVNNIKIKIISGTTTVQDLVDLINNDVTITPYVTAALEGTSTGTNFADLWGPNEWGTDFGQRFLTGGFPGVVHEISSGNLATFFAAHVDNVLQKGDTLAIAYDEIIDETGLGGTLQSTIENTKTVIPAASLINTRREPARAANAVPICKCTDDDTLLFIDGSYIKRGVAATLVSDSGVASAADLILLSTSGWTRMHQAPGAHTPPTTLQQGLNNADDLVETILTEVETARDSASYGAKANLDARLEPPELEIVGARATDPLQPGGGGYADLAARFDRHAGHAAAVVTVSSVVGDDAMYTTIEAAVTALNAADGGTILVRKGAAPYNITSQVNFTKPIRLIAVEPGVEIENNIATAATPPLRYIGGSERSVIWGFKITQGTTGNNLVFSVEGSTFRVTIERCYIEGSVLLDALHTRIVDCDIYEPDIATGDALTWLCLARADHVVVDNCRFFSASSGGMMSAEAYFIASGFSPSQMRFHNCEFDVRDDLCAIGLIDGARHSLENIYITCAPFRATATPIINLVATNMDVDAIRVYVAASSTDYVQQPVFAFGSAYGRAQDIYIDCSQPFVSFLASRNTVRITGVDCTVEDLTVLAKISAATDAAPNPPQMSAEVDPIIYMRCNTTDARCSLKNSLLRLYNSGSGSGGYNVTVFGDDTATMASGSITVDGLRINADAVHENVAQSVRGCVYLPRYAVVRNCHVKMDVHDSYFIRSVGTGFHHLTIENNIVYMNPSTGTVGAMILLSGVSADKGDHTRICGNKYYGGPTTTVTIVIKGAGTGALRADNVLINDNQLFYNAANDGCIEQSWLNHGGLWGNAVFNGTTVITQTDCTLMVPTEATAGTYNTI